jgi:hypothetical protein
MNCSLLTIYEIGGEDLANSILTMNFLAIIMNILRELLGDFAEPVVSITGSNLNSKEFLIKTFSKKTTLSL